ncbi:MAG: 50S ribosomal protein L4 [Phycisphaerae bacterium]|nr:50S ribosomal protein L4 [Phycisphaerae bacterium]
MISLPIYDKSGKQIDTMSIDELTLGGTVRYALLKQAYVITHGNQRQGSARTKSRGMVHGSTRKLYKQKGTGNARVGASRVPNRKGGGVAFPKTRTREDLRTSLSKQAKRLANRNALLAKLVDGEVKCFADLTFTAPKTSDFADVLKAVGIDRTCLVAVDPANRNAMLSARNLEHVDVCRIEQLNVFEVLNHRYLVVDKTSLKSFLDGTCWGEAGDADDNGTAAPSAKVPNGKSASKSSKSKKELA